MTTITVERELLERITRRFGVRPHWDSMNQGEAIAELRALLAEQPQASAAQSAPDEREAVEQQILGRYTVHQTGRGFWPYCVRAGDGERELFVGHKRKCEEVAAALQSACLDGAFMQAAWQRTQLAGVPDGWRLVPAEMTTEMYLAFCDARGVRGTTYKDGWRAALAAAPQPAARQEQADEVRSEWTLCSDGLPADKRDVLVYCSDTQELMVGFSLADGRFQFAKTSDGERIVCRPSHWRYLDEADYPAKQKAAKEAEQ